MHIEHFPQDIKFPFCEKDDLEKWLLLVGLATLLGKRGFSKLIFCLTNAQCGFSSRKSPLPSSGLLLLRRKHNTTLEWFFYEDMILFFFPYAALEISHLSYHIILGCSVLRLSVMSDSVRPHGLQPTRLLRPWDSPVKNTGVGYHAFLQGIFPTQGSNPGLPHDRQILYHLSHQQSPRILVGNLSLLWFPWWLRHYLIALASTGALEKQNFHCSFFVKFRILFFKCLFI